MDELRRLHERHGCQLLEPITDDLPDGWVVLPRRWGDGVFDGVIVGDGVTSPGWRLAGGFAHTVAEVHYRAKVEIYRHCEDPRLLDALDAHRGQTAARLRMTPRQRLIRALTVLAIFVALALVLLRCSSDDCRAHGGHLELTYRVWTCVQDPPASTPPVGAEGPDEVARRGA